MAATEEDEGDVEGRKLSAVSPPLLLQLTTDCMEGTTMAPQNGNEVGEVVGAAVAGGVGVAEVRSVASATFRKRMWIESGAVDVQQARVG